MEEEAVLTFTFRLSPGYLLAVTFTSRTGPFGSLHTKLMRASSFVFISFGRTVTLKVAVVPGFISLLPPETATRSSSQVTL